VSRRLGTAPQNARVTGTALLTSGVALAPGIGSAQAIGGTVVRLIVPYPPGGVTDALARAIAQDVSSLWGRSVIVENRNG